MKRFYVLSLIIMTALASCGGGKTSSEIESKDNDSLPSVSEEESVDEKHIQVIKDNTFKEGFLFNPANGSNPDTGYFPEDRWMGDVKLLYGGASGDNISWIGSQHGDIYSLNDKYNKKAGGTPREENGYYIFEDESKKLAANPSTGSLYFELNASNEYERPRQANEQWCHLLLNQGFQTAVRVEDTESIDFTMDIEMKKYEDHMNGEAQRDLHCVQFLMYLVVKSENSYDSNTFFWFGLPFYDNRYPNGLSEGIMIDSGGGGATSKAIYHIDSTEMMDEGLSLNKKLNIDFDIRPFLQRGLIKAQSMGHLTHTSVDELTFQSMNIGFEITGTYDCGVEISNFSLTANMK